MKEDTPALRRTNRGSGRENRRSEPLHRRESETNPRKRKPLDKRERRHSQNPQGVDVFAWSYKDMPGLDPSLVEHRYVFQPDAKPVKLKWMEKNVSKSGVTSH